MISRTTASKEERGAVRDIPAECPGCKRPNPTLTSYGRCRSCLHQIMPAPVAPHRKGDRVSSKPAPRVVAECWTCARLRGEWAAWSHGASSDPPDESPIYNDATPALVHHRAIGHDVREVGK